MSTAILFDTLAYAKKLKEAGVPERQAEVQAETFAEMVEERMATKQDVKELELRMDVKLADLKAEIIKWVLAVSAGQAVLIISAMKLIH